MKRKHKQMNFTFLKDGMSIPVFLFLSPKSLSVRMCPGRPNPKPFNHLKTRISSVNNKLSPLMKG